MKWYALFCEHEHYRFACVVHGVGMHDRVLEAIDAPGHVREFKSAETMVNAISAWMARVPAFETPENKPRYYIQPSVAEGFFVMDRNSVLVMTEELAVSHHDTSDEAEKEAHRLNSSKEAPAEVRYFPHGTDRD